MDTPNNNAAFWIAGYSDYLRDMVGAADTTRLRYVPAATRYRPRDLAIRCNSRSVAACCAGDGCTPAARSRGITSLGVGW
jgi:hypothetical protein